MSYYLFKPPSHNRRSSKNMSFFHLNTIFSKTFFPSAIIEWNNLNKPIRNSESLSIFKRSILKFIRPSPNSTYNCFNTKGIKDLARLRLGSSHLRYRKFKHGFLDSLYPISSCSLHIETTCQFLLHCPDFINERSLLLNNASRLTKINCLLVTLQLSKFFIKSERLAA